MGSQEAFAQELTTLPNIRNSTFYPQNCFNNETYTATTGRVLNKGNDNNYFGLNASSANPVVKYDGGEHGAISFPNGSGESGYIRMNVGCSGDLYVQYKKKPKDYINSNWVVMSATNGYEIDLNGRVSVGDVLEVHIYNTSTTNSSFFVLKKENNSSQTEGNFNHATLSQVIWVGTESPKDIYYAIDNEAYDELKRNNFKMYAFGDNAIGLQWVRRQNGSEDYRLHISTYPNWNGEYTMHSVGSDIDGTYSQRNISGPSEGNTYKTLYIGTSRDVIITQIDWNPSTSVKVNQEELNLTAGQTVTLTATLTGNNPSVTWKSSDSSIATVTENTDANGVSTATVTAVAKGSVTITAEVDGFNGNIKAETAVTVNDNAAPAPVQITEAWHEGGAVKVKVETTGAGRTGNIGLLTVKGGPSYSEVTLTDGVGTIPYSTFGDEEVGLLAYNTVSYPDQDPAVRTEYGRTVHVQGIDGGKSAIINPDFESNYGVGWTWSPDAPGEGYNMSKFGGNQWGNHVAEMFQTAFDVNQTIGGLENGVYEITAQAFYRTADNYTGYYDYIDDIELKGVAKPLAYLYAGDYGIPVRNLFEEYFEGGENYARTAGHYFPNGMVSAADAFNKGKYTVKFKAVVSNNTANTGEQPNGTLQLGILSRQTEGSNRWTCWDNFSIRKTDETPNSELQVLPNTYKWSFTNGKFGKVGKEYDNATVLVDDCYLEYIASVNNNNHGKIYVTEDGLKINQQNRGSKIHFKIPRPGLIKVRGENDDPGHNNMKIDIVAKDGKHYGTPNPWNDANSRLSLNGRTEVMKFYDEPYDANKYPADVYIEAVGTANSTTNAYFWEIEYLYNPGDLLPHTVNRGSESTPYAYTWTGTSSPGTSSTGLDGYDGNNAKVYSDILNNNSNNAPTIQDNAYVDEFNKRDMRIIADATHTVSISPAGFKFGAKEADGTFGYLMIAATVPGMVRVYTDQSAVGKPLSIGIGTKTQAANNYLTLIDVESNGLAREAKVFGKDENRMIYIAADPDITITKIEWIPNVINGVNSELRAVTKETAWARGNQFGGYYIPSGVNTYIFAPNAEIKSTWDAETQQNGTELAGNRLNYGLGAMAGYPEVPNQTLLIYGGNVPNSVNSEDRPTYFTTTGNLMLNNTSGGSMRFVEFKVKGSGVVKVEAAANGPTARQVDIAAMNHDDVTKTSGVVIEKADLLAHSITTDEGHSSMNGNTPTANEQEHLVKFVRHQHCSYHATFAYFKAPSNNSEQTIIIYAPGGGISIQEIHWYPDKTIYEVAGEGNLSSEGCLNISDKDGNVKNDDGSLTIPKTLYINPRVERTGDKPYWVGDDVLRTDTYNFYAKVVTPYDVKPSIKEPVWTTSQAGRKGIDDKFTMGNAKVWLDADMHTGFDTDIESNGSYIAITGEGHPYTLTVPKRRVFSSKDDAKTATDNKQWNEPTRGENTGIDYMSWGIIQVVAGTWEGNRSDMRRIEVAGPPTNLDIEGRRDVLGLTIQQGKSELVGATPYNMAWDEDGYVNAKGEIDGGAYVRMKYIADPTAVKWVVCDAKGKVPGEDGYDATTFDGEVTVVNDNGADNQVVNGVTEYTKVTGVKAGTAYIKVYYETEAGTHGVAKLNNNNRNVWYDKELVKIIPIKVILNEIHLKRVLLDGETRKRNGNVASSINIENVDVISPLVYEIEGAYKYDADHLDDSTKTTQITALFSNDVQNNTDVPVVGKMKRAEDGRTFVVFNMTKQLQGGVGSDGNGGKNYYEHSNYDALHHIKLTDQSDYTYVTEPPMVYVDWYTETFDEDGNATVQTQTPIAITEKDGNNSYAKKGDDGKSVATNENVLDFLTIHDNSGLSIETYIYNVTQRGEMAWADMNRKQLLSECKRPVVFTANRILSDGSPAPLETKDATVANEASATQSWFSNHRSYIRLDGTFTIDGDKSDLHLKAGDNSKITLKPYDTMYDSSVQNEAINRIALYIDPSCFGDDNTAPVVKFTPATYLSKTNTPPAAGTSVSFTAKDIKDNNGLVSWQFDESTVTTDFEGWIHNVDIEIADGIKIDQLKVDYYSATPTTKVAYKTFHTYQVNDFVEKLKNGMEFSGIGDEEPGIKLLFRQNKDTRHFALLERYERYEDGINRGEQNPNKKNKKQTTLVVRDDKTDPCEFYIYNKEHVANIASIEFVYETDHDEEQNHFQSRDLYCISDPRFVPTAGESNMIGWRLTDAALAAEDYGEGSSNSSHEENGDASKLRKLVYRPESPVNFAAFAMNCNEPGYLFVRKIIVRVDETATGSRYVLTNVNEKDGNLMQPSEIKDLPLTTNGIRLTVPNADYDRNDVKAFLIKRTSVQNNVSQEVPLSATSGGKYDQNNHKIVLNRLGGTGNSAFLHQKNYTIRILDENRIVKRQLAFRTAENETPVITRYEGNTPEVNNELRTEDPLTSVPDKITVTVSNKDGHSPLNTVIVYTTDGSAPSVTFGGATGRRIDEINGYVAAGETSGHTDKGVVFMQGSESDVYTPNTLSLNALFKQYNNAIVIKAIALPLNGVAASTVVDNLIGQECTFGETSEITRANYTLINPDETFFTSARRDVDGNCEVTISNDPMTPNPYDITKDDKDTYPDYAKWEDKFHGAYKPTKSFQSGDRMPEMFTYGGYELYNHNWDNETNRTHRFNHSLLLNEYWQAKGNDATPWRGLRESVAGDTYVMSPLEPYGEKMRPMYSDATSELIPNADYFINSDENGHVRFLRGQFNYGVHNSLTKSYYRTWNLPCYGDYFRFEPEKNGTLTVYVKQQGVLEQENGHVDDQILRLRPVYIFDERGETPADIYATTTSKVGGDWMVMRHTQNVPSRYLDATATELFKKICDQWIKNNTRKLGTTGDNEGDIEYGDRAYESQGVIVLHGNMGKAKAHTKQKLSTGEERELSYDGMMRDTEFTLSDGETYTLADFIGQRDGGEPNGFMVISEGYVKYELPVRAGKTYLMFAANGNLGFCSYTFKEDENVADKTVLDNGVIKTITIEDDGASGAGDGHMAELLACKGKTVNVNLNRKFYNKVWAAVVLPFSVSMHQMRKLFGDGVRVSHFNDIAEIPGVTYTNSAGEEVTGNVDRISVKRHVHQMIVAGVPVFIRPWFNDKPEKDVIYPTFENVTVEADEVEDVETNVNDYIIHPEGVKKHYPEFRCTGTFKFQQGAVKPGDIYMNASKGAFAQRTEEYGNLNMSGTRCWLTPIPKGQQQPTTAPRMLNLVNFSGLSYGVGENNGSTNNSEGGEITTDIRTAESAASYEPGKVYNLKGQLVGNSADDLKHLPQGVYFINGVKHVVK